MEKMSKEKLVKDARLVFSCRTPKECEEMGNVLLSRLAAGERAVKAMNRIKAFVNLREHSIPMGIINIVETYIKGDNDENKTTDD